MDVVIAATLNQPITEDGDLIVIDTLRTQVLGEDIFPALVARAEAGRIKYGHYLRTRNRRKPMVDAMQEIFDALMYLRQAELEGDKSASQLFERAHDLAQDIAYRVRAIKEHGDT